MQVMRKRKVANSHLATGYTNYHLKLWCSKLSNHIRYNFFNCYFKASEFYFEGLTNGEFIFSLATLILRMEKASLMSKWKVFSQIGDFVFIAVLQGEAWIHLLNMRQLLNEIVNVNMGWFMSSTLFCGIGCPTQAYRKGWEHLIIEKTMNTLENLIVVRGPPDGSTSKNLNKRIWSTTPKRALICCNRLILNSIAPVETRVLCIALWVFVSLFRK